jgi:hypothetical protein
VFTSQHTLIAFVLLDTLLPIDWPAGVSMALR